jgi:hypothetical protein
MRYYEKGLKCAKTDKQKSMLAINLASLCIDTGEFDKGEAYCREVLDFDPENQKGRTNLGFCQLAQRNWAEGWPNYRYCIGHAWRPRTQYLDEPEWDGKIKGTIAAYGEQGLGDVISFASIVPDTLKWCKKHDSRLILDVNPSLRGLLQRSFPEAVVYGTRFENALNWDKEDRDIDASLPIGQFAEYFRKKDSDFPGTPFLTVDPDRAFMWKSLLDTKKKPCIGLAWRGGIPKTGAKYRQWDLEQLLPILKSVDAHWVSLQYKPASKEIAAFREKHPEIDLVEYPHATLTQDYDDTAALVSQLDHIVCMQTAITHLAGGLGIPCWTHIPTNSQWRYGGDGEDFIWAKSVRLIRQKTKGEWADIIKQTAKELKDVDFPRVQERTEKATRKRKVRGNSGGIRPPSKSSNRSARNRPSA